MDSSATSDCVKIVEVGPRDGLQNEKNPLSIEDRMAFIQKCAGAGLKNIEGGSFVSSQAVPQMADSEKVWEGCKHLLVHLSFLVPNEKGLERALHAQVRSIAVFTATSDTFNQKNIRMSVEESLKIIQKIVPEAKKSGCGVRGYISTAFGCPYEGPQKVSRLEKMLDQLFQWGCDEISVGDTIGVAHPKQINDVFGQLKKTMGLQKIAGHFHDTRGMALVNIRTALDLGVRAFDSSVGGLGGCPYAPGSSGNVATEEVAWMLEGLGFSTGISIDKLLTVAEWIESKVGHSLKSKFYLSKPKRLYYGE